MSTWSGFLGRADNVVSSIQWLLTPSDDRFFSKGYGDSERARGFQKRFLFEWQKDGLASWWAQSPPLELSWSTEAGNTECKQPDIKYGEHNHDREKGSTHTETESSPQQVYDFTFASPLIDALPSEVGTGHARLMLPDGPVRGIVLHAPGTGQEDYKMRQDKLGVPLLREGIASLLMTVPYYGVRRADGQQSSKLLTVADYQLQCLAVIYEGVALLRWLKATYPSVPLGVTGISWGGSMAACIGVASRLPVACIPCLGSTSGACMVRGLISWQLDWRRLQEEQSHSLEEAKSVLEAEFCRITVKAIADAAPSPKVFIKSMVQVNAKDDYFVQSWEGQDLYGHLAPACDMHSLRWVTGGHVSSFGGAMTDFVKAITDAFDQMAHLEEQAPGA